MSNNSKVIYALLISLALHSSIFVLYGFSEPESVKEVQQQKKDGYKFKKKPYTPPVAAVSKPKPVKQIKKNSMLPKR